MSIHDRPRKLLIIAVSVLIVLCSKSISAHSIQTPSLTSRIVGGEPAEPGEFPWMVALVADGDAFCGGALIDKYWVLTAAHCFYEETNDDSQPPQQDIFPGDFQIVLGTINLNDGSGQTLQAESIIDPGYDAKRNDIALVKLAEPARLDDQSVSLLAVNTDAEFPKLGSDATIAGWGATDIDGSGTPRVLQKVSLPIVRCNADDDSTEYVCAGGLRTKDSCFGDSGGPLVVPQEADSGKAVEIGLSSFGDETCGTVGDYTRTSTYAKWIVTTLRDGPPVTK